MNVHEQIREAEEKERPYDAVNLMMEHDMKSKLRRFIFSYLGDALSFPEIDKWGRYYTDDRFDPGRILFDSLEGNRPDFGGHEPKPELEANGEQWYTQRWPDESPENLALMQRHRNRVIFCSGSPALEIDFMGMVDYLELTPEDAASVVRELTHILIAGRLLAKHTNDTFEAYVMLIDRYVQKDDPLVDYFLAWAAKHVELPQVHEVMIEIH